MRKRVTVPAGTGDRFLKITETGDCYEIATGRQSSRPAILLKGKWLAAAGFAANGRVTVQVGDGILVVKV